VSSKLKEIKNKRDEYAVQKIESILERVAQKPNLDLEEKNLSEEKNILTSQFLEIQQRYEAQLRQLENQLSAFENNIQTEKNRAEKEFNAFEKEINQQYDLIYEDIRKQNQEALATANNNVKIGRASCRERKKK